MAATERLSPRVILVIAVAALGYFVDLFDLVLFSILRVPSLQALGITDPQEITRVGKHLLDIQLIGMLLGGLAFGMLGDRFGRIKTLFGSILLYSVANILNAFITDVWQYEVLRFVAGFGLAGELGAGITLVAEMLPTSKRGIGTTIVASVGLLGAVAAGVVSSYIPWNWCYLIGGVMGLALLAMRIGVVESGLFESMRAKSLAHGVQRGNPLQLLWPPRRLMRFALVVLAPAHVVAVFGNVGQMREVAEGADHAHRLVGRQVLQKPVKHPPGAGVLLQPVGHRQLAHPLDQLEGVLALLFAYHLAEDPAQ